MPTTNQLLSAQTLTSTTSSVIFSSIPQTFTDLKLIISARDDRPTYPVSDLAVRIGYNGTINTGSIYSFRRLYANGTAVGSGSDAQTYMYLPMGNGSAATTNSFGNSEIYFSNYTSSDYKSVSTDGVAENNSTEAWNIISAALISTNNPITDIRIYANYGSGNFQIGSSFYLYGIDSNASTQNTSGPYAFGGDTITTDGTYWYHTFLNSNSFTPQKNLTVDYLVVAGGGRSEEHTSEL